MPINLTQEQKDHILLISRQAQSFIVSDLYKEWEKWVETEKRMTANAIVMNTREEMEKDLTRSEFIERKCSYYLALSTILSVFKGYASHEGQLKSQEEVKDGTDTSSNQG